MKKKLVIINGTMGIGKSATCRELYSRLNNSVWLDGDWCWMMNPFIVNDENKRMVEKNITFLLRSFLTNSSFEYVIFDWVIHREEIFDIILNGLNDLKFDVYKITLTCSKKALKDRIIKDIHQGLRDEDCIDGSIERLELYKDMDTEKVDTTGISPSQAADEIIRIIEG